MTLWENLKKGIIEGLHTATDKTSEYTKIGRIKIDVLSIKKEIEEKLIELGGRLYHSVAEDNIYDIQNDEKMMQLVGQVKELEGELKKYAEELKRIKENNGIDLD